MEAEAAGGGIKAGFTAGNLHVQHRRGNNSADHLSDDSHELLLPETAGPLGLCDRRVEMPRKYGRAANAKNNTVKPNASATPANQYPSSGEAAAARRRRSRPNTSQKVPVHSAANFLNITTSIKLFTQSDRAGLNFIVIRDDDKISGVILEINRHPEPVKY